MTDSVYSEKTDDAVLFALVEDECRLTRLPWAPLEEMADWSAFVSQVMED